MNVVIIDGDVKAPCALCGRVAVLRPYGKAGSFICVSCALQDEQTASEQFFKLLSENDRVIIVQKVKAA